MGGRNAIGLGENRVRKKLFAAALLTLTTATGAQTPAGSARHQLVGVGSDGWRWYAVKDSKRLLGTSPYRVYGFWMTGENPASPGARYGKVQVKFACTGVGWFVATHVTLYDSRRRVVRDMLTGDDSPNWERVASGNPMDGAGRWACSPA